MRRWWRSLNGVSTKTLPILHLVVLTFGHTAAFGGRKLVNKIGDLLTITHEIWELSWDPDGKGSVKDLVTFGRNRSTGYSGLIRVQAIAELEPEELESWRRSNLLPPGRDYPEQHTLSPLSSSIVSSLQRTHCSLGTCNCQEKIDPVAEYKRNNPTLGWQSNPSHTLDVFYPGD